MVREYHRAMLILASALASATPSHRSFLLLLTCCLWAAPTAFKPINWAQADAESLNDRVAQLSLPSSLPSDRIPSQPLPPADITPDLQPSDRFPEQPLPQLPPVDDLLGNPSEGNSPAGITDNGDETFVINKIELTGSTVFTAEDFAELFDQYTGRPVTFNELLQIRSAVTERYVEEDFVTSGAFIPPQTLEAGVLTVQVIEGVIEEIEIEGTRRLNPNYIRSRLNLVTQPPINTKTLLEGLQRLQIDPLIDAVSADLQASVNPGSSILQVKVTEADSFALNAELDNNRSPNIGSIRRQITLTEGNLLGIGDRAYLGYANTDGSNSFDLSYSIPISPRNTRLNFEGGISESRVIDDTFDILDISSDAYYYGMGITHPLIETPTQELSLGLAFSAKQNQTSLGIDNIGPFPLSPGADSNGETRINALRFSQTWTQRSEQQVFAARSQFNLGLNILDATDNQGNEPDSQFFSWRGQGQWVRLLGENSLLFLRGDVQLASDNLLTSEQFGLGGQQTVRGYRQDAFLRDNGALVSAEARFPLIRFAENSLVQITPFLDMGIAWNHQNTPSGNNILAGAGMGLLWQQDDNLSARIDWGIPLVDIDSSGDSLQDSGIYFSLQYSLF